MITTIIVLCLLALAAMAAWAFGPLEAQILEDHARAAERQRERDAVLDRLIAESKGQQ